MITFGQTNDQRIGKLAIGTILEDALVIMDRGFTSWKLIDEMCNRNTLFIVRIRNNIKLNPDNPNVRVIQFFNEEDNIEYRIATNVQNMSDEEIREAYRLGWQIEDALEIGQYNHKE